MPKLYRQSYLMAKTETAVGTENAPTLGLSVVKAYEVDFQQIAESTNTTRSPMTGAIGATEIDVPGAFAGTVKCKTYLSGSGTVAQAPAWAPLMIGCGWQQDYTAATSIVFKPATAYAPGAWANNSDFAGMTSLTMHNLMGDTAGGATANLWKLRGCMGDWTLDLEMGKPGAFTWDFKGAFVQPTDDETFTAATISAEADPLACMNVGATWTPYPAGVAGSAHTMVLRKFSLKSGNKATLRPDMNSVGGYVSNLIHDRLITYTMEIEVPVDFDVTAGTNWYGHLQQTAAVGSYGNLEIGAVGATAGNIWAINIPKAGVGKVTPSNGDGIMVFTIEGSCATSNLSTGGDEVTITLT
jgi:hypothetical protein